MAGLHKIWIWALINFSTAIQYGAVKSAMEVKNSFFLQKSQKRPVLRPYLCKQILNMRKIRNLPSLKFNNLYLISVKYFTEIYKNSFSTLKIFDTKFLTIIFRVLFSNLNLVSKIL